MSICVVLGNTFSVKEELKLKYGFSFNWDYKVWYKPVQADKFPYWKTIVEAYSKEIEACWVNDFDDIPKLLNAIKAEKAEIQVEMPSLQSHKLDGKVIEISKWLANKIKEEAKTSVAFRNLEVIKVHRETHKAILVDIKYYSGITCSCGICGRALDNPISKATGIGPVCAEKIGLSRPKLEQAEQTIKELEALCDKQGVISKVWVAKSMIKNIHEVA